MESADFDRLMEMADEIKEMEDQYIDSEYEVYEGLSAISYRIKQLLDEVTS